MERIRAMTKKVEYTCDRCGREKVSPSTCTHIDIIFLGDIQRTYSGHDFCANCFQKVIEFLREKEIPDV